MLPYTHTGPMRRVQNLWRLAGRWLVAAGLAAVLLGLTPTQSQAQDAPVAPAAVHTIVTQNIAADTTWTAAGSPYEIANDIIVNAGVTLTIQPGVEVRFAQYAGLRVLGTLRAVGTEGSRILFTGSTAQKGWWEKISIEGTAGAPNNSSVLDYVTIEYGGGSYANLYLYYATLSISHAIIRQSAADGIYGDTRGMAHLTESSFTDNGSDAGDYAVRFNDGSINPTLAALSASGNGVNAIALGSGTLTGDHVWERMGLPYIPLSDLVVPAGSSLVIQPGVEVRFAQHAGLRALGTLTAVGTEAERILFTGTTAQKGWWEKLSIEGNGTTINTASAIAYATIEYGGGSYANLYLYLATVPVSHATIRQSGADGLYGDSRGVAHLTNVSFTDNGTDGNDYPVRFNDGSMNPVLTGLSASGNQVDAVALGGGALSGEHRWERLPVPYLILGDQTVPAGSTLVIEPGVVVRFAQYAGLRALGTLTAVGTELDRILFTGSSPQKGWWEKISIEGSGTQINSTSQLDYVTIEYGGGSYANLYLYLAAVPVSHTTIRQSGADGLYGDSGGVAHLSHTSFVENGTAPNHYALRFTDGSVNPVLAYVTASGNSVDTIALGGGTLTGDHVWEALAIPYSILGDQRVAIDASLTIEAGVQVRFAQHAGLRALGRLTAIGREDAPILFTGTTQQRGWWEKISIEGTNAQPNEGSALKYVTIEYGGGSYANLYLYYATVTVAESIIRQSAADGVYVDGGAGNSTIESSQIVENAAYGLRNAPQNALFMAANNWWGAASGPKVDQNCNAGGSGSVVTLNVEYRPFLTAGNAEVNPVAPPVAYSISIAPQRWYIPADGVTRGEVLITLRDGEGNPISGREVQLFTTVGSALSGGITDARGQARARVWSSSEGVAQLTAKVEDPNPCVSGARSGASTVTFTAFNPGSLTPGAAAPYMDDALQFIPEPIVQGVLTRVTARVVNPNNFPIAVNGNFSVLQSGIGLSQPPVGEVEGYVIPPNSVGVMTIQWTPPISGHYCIVFEYTWQEVGAVAGAAVQSGGGRSQKNLNVYGPPPDDKNDKDILKKASDGMSMVKKVGKKGLPKGFIPLKGAEILTEWQLSKAAEISQAMGGDPPRQDYTTIAQAEPVLLAVVQPSGELTPQMAAALNTLRTALAWANAHGDAYLLSYDRYGGAANAGNLTWASQQMSVMIDHKHEMAKRLLDAADALDAYRAARQAAGIEDLILTAEEIRAYQQDLETNGFAADEIAAARAVGMSDAQIEAARLQTIAADPDEQAGSFMAQLEEIAGDLRRMGGNILYPPTFGGSVGGSAGLLASGASLRADIPPMPEVPESNNLARVYEVVDTIQVGNPTGQTATIEMVVRPIDLPAGWMVSVTPSSLTLAAGAQAPVEVRITPGGPAVQGTAPRVAIEGYAGELLLGGVTMDVLVPKNAFKPAPPVYLPTVEN